MWFVLFCTHRCTSSQPLSGGLQLVPAALSPSGVWTPNSPGFSGIHNNHKQQRYCHNTGCSCLISYQGLWCGSLVKLLATFRRDLNVKFDCNGGIWRVNAQQPPTCTTYVDCMKKCEKEAFRPELSARRRPIHNITRQIDDVRRATKICRDANIRIRTFSTSVVEEFSVE